MSEWSTLAAEKWDQFAADWHANSDNMWENGSRRTILPFLQKYVSISDGPILDAGCADGYASCKLASIGYAVEGIDIAGEMIRLANDRAKEQACRSLFKQVISASSLLQTIPSLAPCLSTSWNLPLPL